MNRRLFLSGLSLAPLLVLPEPRRVYSFLDGWRETERERIMRDVREVVERYFQERLSRPIVIPRGVNVECIGSPNEILKDKRLTMRVTVQPHSWAHAQSLLAQGFELA